MYIWISRSNAIYLNDRVFLPFKQNLRDYLSPGESGSRYISLFISGNIATHYDPDKSAMDSILQPENYTRRRGPIVQSSGSWQCFIWFSRWRLTMHAPMPERPFSGYAQTGFCQIKTNSGLFMYRDVQAMI